MDVPVRRPPGPRPLLPLLNLRGLRSDPLRFFLNAARTYGDVVNLPMFIENVFLLGNPDHIRDVLVTHNRNFTKSRGLHFAKRVLGQGLLTSEGEFHTRQRRLVQPAFHRDRIAAYAQVMSAYATRSLAEYRQAEPFDMHQRMMRLTLAVVAKTLFDADVEKESASIGQALGVALNMFQRVMNPMAEFMEKLPLPGNRRFAKALQFLDDTIYGLIREHRASGDRGDLLSMLLAAQDTEGDGTGMTDLQVRDEAMTLFLAGHETTANALTWTWYLLARHPDVEQELHRELDSVPGNNPPTFADLERLPYTLNVLTESMRLYPPAWIIGRRAVDAYTVDGYRVPPRATVLMSPYIVHRDPRFYHDPEKFLPERWTPQFRQALPKFAYFPFGGGPRVCIGEGFAWTEGLLLLATIARHWCFRLVPGHQVALQPLITLRPRYGMMMTAEAR